MKKSINYYHLLSISSYCLRTLFGLLAVRTKLGIDVDQMLTKQFLLNIRY
ncbi:hypothetical protein M2408_000255 [Sphingobacterium sp. BIGb0165]|nr:hypothetical protein [Sphingobacterium sp. BIGb0165]